jgi:hypothetical protein
MFFHDALIWLSIAFDAVLKCAVAFRKLSHNLIGTWQGITKRKGSVENPFFAACAASSRSCSAARLQKVMRPSASVV